MNQAVATGRPVALRTALIWRDEVIRYVQERYGRDRVAQIITFGKLQARAVLRDVGRALGMRAGRWRGCG